MAYGRKQAQAILWYSTAIWKRGLSNVFDLTDFCISLRSIEENRFLKFQQSQSMKVCKVKVCRFCGGDITI